jgi:cytosine/adenosine deaminase-related metal-dependent hydrolase
MAKLTKFISCSLAFQRMLDADTENEWRVVDHESRSNSWRILLRVAERRFWINWKRWKIVGKIVAPRIIETKYPDVAEQLAKLITDDDIEVRLMEDI